MESTPRRDRPLSLRAGGSDLVLHAADVNLLIESIARLVERARESYLRPGRVRSAAALGVHIGELEALQQALLAGSRSLAEPPLSFGREQAALLRSVLADIAGYQRRELTGGLLELRRLLDDR